MSSEENRLKVHDSNRKIFAIMLMILELIILIFYGLFVRPDPKNDSEWIIHNNFNYYSAFQDVNVMMLVGFGFLMTFIKRHSWSALSYTFLINAIVVQFYLLISAFWERAFSGHWSEEVTIHIASNKFTAAAYSVAAILIAFGGVLGKVGPLELLIMSIIGTIGYTLNEVLIYTVLELFDAGGSTAIHTFGAYLGLTVSFILSKKVSPSRLPESSYTSNIFAMIGTLFLWMFWPSFNAGFFPETQFEKNLIIGNTIISLTASCIATFAISALFRDKFSMEDILNASLAGGVAIGAGSGVITNPAASLSIGLIAGVVSTLGFIKLTPFLEHKIGLYDTCGINNLHGIPGIIGGISSAIVIAAYESSPISQDMSQYLRFYNATPLGRNFSQQAGIQVAGTFISMFLGIFFGVIAGIIIYFVYKFNETEFFEDQVYFEIPKKQTSEFHEIIPGSASLEIIK